MQSIWKGTIAFGLVSIPVKLYSATQEHAVSFHQVRATDGARVRQKRYVETDGEEIEYRDVAKGYTTPEGKTVILTDEDLKTLPVPTQRTIQVEQFVAEDEVDPVLYQKTYYLEPDKTAVKPYVLLRDSLEESGLVGVVKVAIRQRETVAVLRVRDGVFALTTMLWADEVRAPDFAFLDQDITVSAGERKAADQLISAMTDSFDVSVFTDDYTAALETLIEAKGGGVSAPVVEEEKVEDSNVVDLMSALRESINAQKNAKAHHPAGKKADEAPQAAPAKKAATKKAPAAKTTAKKAPAKKAPAKAAAKKSA